MITAKHNMKLSDRYLILQRPDIVQKRNDEVLLVWGDIPFWTVVDNDMFRLLNLLTGEKTLSDILTCRNTWSSQLDDIFKAISILEKYNIIKDINKTKKSNTQNKVSEYKIENVALNITRNCNLKCSICYNQSYNNDNFKMELSADEIINTLKQIKPLKSKSAILTILGGEPLLVQDKLLKVSKAGKKMGYTVLISTNGTGITDDFACKARELGLEIQVSIDGHNSIINDRIRGGGSFDSIIKGIKKLVDNKVYTILSFVCCAENMDYLEEFYRLALSLKVNEARFLPLKLIGGGRAGKFTPAGMHDLVLKVNSMLQKNPEFQKLMGRDFYSILETTCFYSNKRKSCGSGLQTVLIDSDGSLYPCINTANKEFRISHIHDKSFRFTDVWQKSEFLLQYRKKTAIDEMNNNCSVCPVRYWCLGNCRGEAYHTKNDISSQAHNCNDMKKAIIEMLWALSENAEKVSKSNLNRAYSYGGGLV
jgi:radical SAM protein with 4Fe4S-binding SPASM domain